jgi:hypothetical protein
MGIRERTWYGYGRDPFWNRPVSPLLCFAVALSIPWMCVAGEPIVESTGKALDRFLWNVGLLRSG